MTMRDTSSDEGGASVFNSRGQRVNEIDLDAQRHGKTADEMSKADWKRAAALLREFDEGPQ